MKKNNLVSIKSFIKEKIIILSFLFLALIVSAIFCVAASYLVSNKIALIVFYLVLFALIFILLTFIIVNSISLYKVCYDDAYKVILDNLTKFAKFGNDLNYINNKDVAEFNEINKVFKSISKNYNGVSLINKKSGYSSLNLNFLDEQKRFISEDELLNNIEKIILVNECFKNALIEINYELEDEELVEAEITNIEKYINRRLGYENMLIAIKNDRKGLYLYVPCFDSLSQLQEELVTLVKDILLIKRLVNGRKIYSPYISFVIYPYSEINSLKDDLKLAKEKHDHISLYIPPFKAREKQHLLLSSMNLNIASLIKEDIASKVDKKDFHEFDEDLSFIVNYYDFSCAGIILYDYDKKGFFAKTSLCPNSNPPFRLNGRINKNFIAIIDEIKDKDNTYYFSSRKHVNNILARFLDEYHLYSGLFYVIKDNGKTLGLIYFANKSKELGLDSYLVNSLITCSVLIGDAIKQSYLSSLTALFERRFSSLLSFSNLYSYVVDKNDYKLLATSSLFSSVKDVKIGEHCYKEIYGLDKPCVDCPLLLNKHKLSKIGDATYDNVTYPTLNDNDALIFLKPSTYSLSNFDDNTLLPSFYCFVNDVKKNLSLNTNGSIILFKIKNFLSFVENNILFAKIVQFAKAHEHYYFYQYDESTLALSSSLKDENAIIDKLEKLVENEADFFGLEFIYLVKQYQGNEEISEIIKSLKNKLDECISLPKNEIYFIDTNYKRSASKEGYLYESIVDAMENNNFHLEYQMVLNNSDRLIASMELLLRIIDKNTSLPLDVYNAIKIAKKYHYSGKITKIIIDYVDSLLNKYGYTFFMTSNLDKLRINTDEQYFETDYENQLKAIKEKHGLKEGFIAFEVDEETVFNNKDLFAKNAEKLHSLGVSMIVDSYKGELLTIQEIKQLGFEEVKIPRSLVNYIFDENIMNKIASIWKDANKYGIKISFVGIATRQISEAIHMDDNDCFVQGNYFFNPMEEKIAFDALKERNLKEKEKDI